MEQQEAAVPHVQSASCQQLEHIWGRIWAFRAFMGLVLLPGKRPTCEPREATAFCHLPAFPPSHWSTAFTLHQLKTFQKR